MTTIVLCAGPINFMDLPVASNRSNAMIPVAGKPVISWILDDLIEKNIGEATIVIRPDDQHLRSFVERSYSRRLCVRIVEAQSRSINESLLAGVTASSPGPLRVVLGDTLIRDEFTGDQDFIYTVPVESSRKWCLVTTDAEGKIIDYIDKKGFELASSLGAAGYYHLLDGELLGACVRDAVASGERELSDTLRRYGRVRPIRSRLASSWFDFGHIEALVDARHRLIAPRHFNTMRVDPLLKTITKSSENDAKLRDERDWYRELPDDLKVLSPRILREEEVDGRLLLTQEYYGYPTLAELYLYGDLQIDTWSVILRYVLRIHDELRKHRGEIPHEDVRFMYDAKVFSRLDSLSTQGELWTRLLALPTLRLNGSEVRNVPLLADDMRKVAAKLASNSEISIIHGDLCFSNVLFDINNQIIRLIDPRGSFARKGIWGDPRYDLAKLRHSASGKYDFIVTDAFSVDENASGFELQIHDNESARGVAHELDRQLEVRGFDLDEIRTIEAMLFISMVPLHRDYPRRQLAMYLTGISQLDRVLAR